MEDAVGHYRFLAFLSVDPVAQGEPSRTYASGSHDLMIRCCRLDEPAVRRYFSASIYRDDGQALRPGDEGVLATVEVLDDQATSFLGPGQHITLWNGRECGHGVISRRVFMAWAR
jgi:hypothetical protein